MLEHAQALSKGPWLEPGAGEGNLIRGVQDLLGTDSGPVWDACELRPECESHLNALGVRNISIGDYFVNGPPSEEEYAMIISNPPFSLAMEFIRRSLESKTRFVVMLQRMNYIGSERRHPFMSTCPPDLYVLPNRPSFKADGSTDSIEYAWFVWDKMTLGSPGKYTLLDLTPKEERKAEHERIKNNGIFPVFPEDEEEAA